MFIHRKKYPSGSIEFIVAEKPGGKVKELVTTGISKAVCEIERLVIQGKEWLEKEQIG